MGNYEQLKQAVSSVIKDNGNMEITGDILQNTLLSIISTVGGNATFAGIATPTTNPGIPDQNVFYLASEPGVYTNFGGVNLIDQVLIFANTNGQWVAKNTNIPLVKTVNEVRKTADEAKTMAEANARQIGEVQHTVEGNTQSIKVLQNVEGYDVLVSGNTEVSSTADSVDIRIKNLDINGPSTDVETINIPAATESKAGVMSPEDKKTLNIVSNGKYQNMSYILYSELKNLRDNSQLVEGRYYRITDFVTTVDQADARSAGNVFDIIVLATSPNTLNENALAAKHEGDTYFANSNLDAWELKYDLDNDKSKYAWADETNGKGVIYYLKDEFNNECPYDFKNVLFKRYKLKGKSGLHLADYPLTDSEYDDPVKQAFINWQSNLGTSINDDNIAFYYTRGVNTDNYIVSGADIFNYDSSYDSYDNGNLVFDENSGGNYISVTSVFNWFDVIAEVADINGEWFYTFSKKTTATSAAVDSSLYKTCNNNSIKEYINSDIRNLNDNIFICLSAGSSYVYGNNLDVACNHNTFGSNCYSNTFGSDCNSNTFGSYCYYNTFGSNCYSNTFGSDCNSNTFGSDCNSNTFGSYCYSNTFGSYCYSNTFGSDCNSNTFGSSCSSNTFGSNCSSNTFGNSCSSNTFGSYYSSNKVKNETNGTSFELYTTGSSMKIQYLTINYISNKTIPAGLITLNAKYTQVLGLNSSGELVCKPALD